jgi:hypothetical protein
MPPKSKAKKSVAPEPSSEVEATQSLGKVTTDSMLMIFEYCLSHGISEIVSSMSSPEFLDKYSLRAPIEQQLGLHLEFFLLRKSLQNKDFESALSLWTSLIQPSDQSECGIPLAVQSFLSFASRKDITAQGLRNHADIVLPADAKSGKSSQHGIARDKIDLVLSAKLGSPAFFEAKEALQSSFPANSVAQQCLDVVMQHASALPRPLLEEMISHYRTTGEHAARNAHPPPNIEIISASELVDIAGGADAFRKIWKCEHHDVQKFIEAKAQTRAARGEASMAQSDLQWHRVEASEASLLSAQVAASQPTAQSAETVASHPIVQSTLKRARASADSVHPSSPSVRGRPAPEAAAASTPVPPAPVVQTASVRKALSDIGTRTKRLHAEADPLADMSCMKMTNFQFCSAANYKSYNFFAAARINARQATSTRVTFSDDEDPDEPQAATWKPKANLVTPAKSKVNPIPSTVTSRGPKSGTAWSEAVCSLMTFALELRFILSFSGGQSFDSSYNRIRLWFMVQNEKQIQIFEPGSF